MIDSPLINSKDVSAVANRSIKRDVPASKQQVHFGSFEAIEALLSDLNFKTTLFKVEAISPDFFEESNRIVSFLSKNLPTFSNQKLIDDTFDYLAQEDELSKCDVVFVYGSKDIRRALRGGQILKSGLASWAYFSGSRPIEDPQRPHEGQSFRDRVISEFELDPKNLVADPNENSHTMADNVRGFLNYLDMNKIEIKSIIMIASTHYLRRGWATLEKYVPQGTIVLRCSAGDRENVGRENWYKSDEGIHYVVEEYLKIKLQQLSNWA